MAQVSTYLGFDKFVIDPITKTLTNAGFYVDMSKGLGLGFKREVFGLRPVTWGSLSLGGGLGVNWIDDTVTENIAVMRFGLECIDPTGFYIDENQAVVSKLWFSAYIPAISATEFISSVAFGQGVQKDATTAVQPATTLGDICSVITDLDGTAIQASLSFNRTTVKENTGFVYTMATYDITGVSSHTGVFTPADTNWLRFIP
jgi:hypothetical protein